MFLKSVIRVNMHIKELMMQTHCIADVERDAGMRPMKSNSTDLISRRAAIDVIDKIFPADPMHNEYTQGITCGAALAMEYIKQLPPAEPKKGRWIRNDNATYSCSVCQSWIPEEQHYYARYCLYCGTKMEVTE